MQAAQCGLQQLELVDRLKLCSCTLWGWGEKQEGGGTGRGWAWWVQL